MITAAPNLKSCISSWMLTALCICAGPLYAANEKPAWKPVPGHIMTKWADDVDPDNPLPEYPRPQLVRDNWVNLNGLWDYAVTRANDPQPTGFEGQILVPFCIESALSGVKRKFTRDDRLWYSRSFDAPTLAEDERLRLNFGAVDYEATVRINGKQVGTHKGGYDAFSFDITDAVQPGENTLVVSVLDAQNGPKGKQNFNAFDNPRFIFYTATSGIYASPPTSDRKSTGLARGGVPSLKHAASQPIRLAKDDILMADFEGSDYAGWKTTGDAFGDKPTGTKDRSNQLQPTPTENTAAAEQ